MFTSQDYWNAHRILESSLIQTIYKCIDILLADEKGKQFENDLWFDVDNKFAASYSSDTIIAGLCGKMVIVELYNDDCSDTPSVWEYSLDCSLFDFEDLVGILERIQAIMDNLSIEYKNAQ